MKLKKIKSYFTRKTLIIISVIIALVLLILSIIYFDAIVDRIEQFANWTYGKDEDRNGKVVDLLLKIFGGIILLLGLIAALIRARSSLKNINNQTKQIELSRDSQLNEQFKNAVEHLASEDESIQLGGITELHYLAQENPKKFSKIVCDMFCIKLRNKCSLIEKTEKFSLTITQSIINYIFKNDVYKNINKNLKECDFSKNIFKSTKIYNCNFKSSILPININDLQFCNCTFQKVVFKDRQLTNIKFDNCNIRFVTFSNCLITNLVMNSSIYYSLFTNCKFRNSEFTSTINSLFCDCIFLDFTFSNIYKMRSLNEVSFYKSIFYDFLVSGFISSCEFKACNFSGKIIFGMNPLGSSFKGIFKDYNNIYIKYVKTFDYEPYNFIDKENDFSGVIESDFNPNENFGDNSVLTEKQFHEIEENISNFKKKYDLI